MKYIRTKYAIYKKDKVSIVKENDIELVILGVCDDYIERTRGKTWNCKTNVIIKQADTIDELCDEFVVYEEDQPKPINMPLTEKTQFEKMKEIIKLGLKTKINCWLKVAIWTDKGLIYVAKMNDKGELELL